MQKKLLVVLFAMLFIFGITTSAYAAYSGTAVPATLGAPSYSEPLTSGDNLDNGVGNANDTGNDTGAGTTNNTGADVNKVIKSDVMANINGTAETQRTHGFYQANTNSCASCHQTHTAAAKSLLFKAGVYATCTACHDGTLGFYNVFGDTNMNSGEIPTAGTFGGGTDGNPSVHLCDGTIGHNLAPGGNYSNVTSPTAYNPDGQVAGANGNWTEKFDCASCHAPHGSFSDRLLHYSPNGMGAVPIGNGGLQIKDIAVAASAPSTGSGFVLVVNTASALGLTITGDPVAARVYDVSNQIWDTTPWLTSTKLYAGATAIDKSSTDVKFIFGKSYVYDVTAGTLATVTKGNIDRAYVVKLATVGGDFDFDPIADFGTIQITAVNPDIYDEAGFGQAITAYCAACHTDYKAQSGSQTGMYKLAYRHSTKSDFLTCLKCHFAHGTDVDVMKDAQDRTVASIGGVRANAVAYMIDRNPSSALKRYTNMAVCWKCHTSAKSTMLINNEAYWTNNLNGTAPQGPTNW